MGGVKKGEGVLMGGVRKVREGEKGVKVGVLSGV